MNKVTLAIVIGYFVLINLVAVFITKYDKHKARHGGWRVPEKTLLAVAVLGGSLAMWITMYKIHHKTRHHKFTVGLPGILLAQVCLLVAALCYFDSNLDTEAAALMINIAALL